MGEPHNFLTIKRGGEANIKIDQKESKSWALVLKLMFVKIAGFTKNSTSNSKPMSSQTSF